MRLPSLCIFGLLHRVYGGAGLESTDFLATGLLSFAFVVHRALYYRAIRLCIRSFGHSSWLHSSVAFSCRVLEFGSPKPWHFGTAASFISHALRSTLRFLEYYLIQTTGPFIEVRWGVHDQPCAVVPVSS